MNKRDDYISDLFTFFSCMLFNNNSILLVFFARLSVHSFSLSQSWALHNLCSQPGKDLWDGRDRKIRQVIGIPFENAENRLFIKLF